jgi:hypothetical protein
MFSGHYSYAFASGFSTALKQYVVCSRGLYAERRLWKIAPSAPVGDPLRDSRPEGAKSRRALQDLARVAVRVSQH